LAAKAFSESSSVSSSLSFKMRFIQINLVSDTISRHRFV
jgi:hypothetical protein